MIDKIRSTVTPEHVPDGKTMQHAARRVQLAQRRERFAVFAQFIEPSPRMNRGALIEIKKYFGLLPQPDPMRFTLAPNIHCERIFCQAMRTVKTSSAVSPKTSAVSSGIWASDVSGRDSMFH